MQCIGLKLQQHFYSTGYMAQIALHEKELRQCWNACEESH